MYAKIQKDITDNYILLESSNIELCFFTFPTTYTSYVKDFLFNILDEETIISPHSEIGEKLVTFFGNIDFKNIKAATHYCFGDCKCYDPHIDCSCTIKGIKVDGVCYVTCGNIYIMNDKGQTIQKI